MKTLHINLRHFLPALLFTAAFLTLVEMAFRRGDWFYDYKGWESPGLAKKMEKARELAEEKGRIDLMVLSTSVGRVIDLHQYEEATSGSIVGYNFGFPDQRPERQNFLFRRYFHPEFKPSHVIYGIAPTDTNSNGRAMHPDRPKEGAFWSYRKVRELSAYHLMDRVIVNLERYSHLFRSRHRARFSLQVGEIAMLPEDPTIGSGIIVPTVRRQAYGPLSESWALQPEGLKYNVYHDYWIPDNGEIGEIIKLGKYCEEQGVKFAVVEVPTSPYAHTNFTDPEGYWRFTNALDHVRNQGIEVLPMARDLKLDNTYFEDQDHLNRWGGQAVTNYIYENLIRKWFAEKVVAPDLPQPVEIPIAEIISETTGVEVLKLDTKTTDAQYAALKQVQVRGSTDIVLTGSLTAGSYAVEVYAGDGTTHTPEFSGLAKVSLVAIDESGTDVASLLLDKWILSRVGISYTQAYFNVPESAKVVLRINGRLKNNPLILDSVFIRRRLSDVDGNQIIVE